jgi:hypothetical protein
MMANVDVHQKEGEELAEGLEGGEPAEGIEGGGI